MLSSSPPNEPKLKRNQRRERRLWHDGKRHSASLGCMVCPERQLCGGLSIGRALFSCLDFCCGEPESCDVVCRNHPEFAHRVWEIGGFALETVPRAPVLPAPKLPPVIPLMFHGKCREGSFAPAAVALSLYQMFNRRDGSLRFRSPEALCKAFGLGPETPIVLSGTEQDPPLERWWSLGDRRGELIRGLRAAGVVLVTTPNYSLFTDQPRWDDMHSMKRIALVHQEFLAEGLPAALHVNARTETDFRRWVEYVRARPEVTHLAYEFTTGTGWAGRRERHATWLAELARAVGRPLDLVVRGGIKALPVLTAAFARVSVIETSVFMKTIKRRRAVPNEEAAPTWQPAPTPIGAPLDALLNENLQTVESWLCRLAGANNAMTRPKFGHG